MRDMVQNHLMQLLCLTAMEPPYAKFDSDAVRDEKAERSSARLDPVAPDDMVRGQYGAVNDEVASSYLDRRGKLIAARTESYHCDEAAHLANWRWNGTPFYLRTGKRLKRARMSEIVVRVQRAAALDF